ncbi:hypothetical protein OTK49_03280 [Vibrio coralliirubri]|uniref:hypothetical protein n=1 Tax=Vibrio coralliirubri TaxID=1516159 RepID=UPI002283F796|nr:hypothetical protein [Vibrio coralliirubri]MCY9861539.1 hypothetical protein [Vibrio coralliirubri]
MLKRAFIWVWYHDNFRFPFVLMGGHLLFTLPPILFLAKLVNLELHGEDIRTIALMLVTLMYLLALTYNDYSNLRRIGLDEHRSPLKH